MALPLVLGPILSALAPWITRFFMAKAVLLFAGFMGRLGLVIATNEIVMQPLIETATQAWLSIPPDWQCWFALFGVLKVASILVSGMTLLSVKQVFFAKS